MGIECCVQPKTNKPILDIKHKEKTLRIEETLTMEPEPNPEKKVTELNKKAESAITVW